jgi:ATP-binding protein involved in chromosome partitioning
MFWKKNKDQKENSANIPSTNSPKLVPENGPFLIAIGSGKGGVGKSTVTTTLAFALAKRGYKVGVLDADIYGPSQPRLMGEITQRAQGGPKGEIIPIEKNNVKFVSMGSLVDNESPVVWRAPMVSKILHQFLKNVLWGELDFLLIDLPPGTGDIQITFSQQAKLTGSLIVTTPQQLASSIAKKGLQMFQQVNVPILGIIENMSTFSCPHCHKTTDIFSHSGGEKLSQEFNIPFLGSIPLDPAIMEASDRGEVLLDHYDSIVNNLENSLTQQLLNQKNILKPEKININEQNKLSIIWTDGHESQYNFFDLRLKCPCASCVDENTGKRILKSEQIPLDIRIEKIQNVGHYGVTIHFSDHHNTGIYKFTLLREICQCSLCASDDAFSV